MMKFINLTIFIIILFIYSNKALTSEKIIIKIKINNEITWLGEFPHSPIHLYLKKDGNDVIELKQLKSPFISGNKT